MSSSALALDQVARGSRLAAVVRSLTALHWALFFSLSVHGALLTLRFVNPVAFDRLFRPEQLEVVLVNAHSKEAPAHAQAFAQANLAGGGDSSDSKLMASTPLPASPTTSQGDSALDELGKLQKMQTQQAVLLSDVRNQIALLGQRIAQMDGNDPSTQLLEDKRKQLLDRLGVIERRIEMQNARPKKRYISPAVSARPFALYYDHLRRQIEEQGTTHFPVDEAGNKIYGELLMEITVLSSGELSGTRILQGSGNPELDVRARAIVRGASGFGVFSPEMRKDADVLAIVARFTFQHDATLSATLMEEREQP